MNLKYSLGNIKTRVRFGNLTIMTTSELKRQKKVVLLDIPTLKMGNRKIRKYTAPNKTFDNLKVSEMGPLRFRK